MGEKRHAGEERFATIDQVGGKGEARRLGGNAFAMDAEVDDGFLGPAGAEKGGGAERKQDGTWHKSK